MDMLRNLEIESNYFLAILPVSNTNWQASTIEHITNL